MLRGPWDWSFVPVCLAAFALVATEPSLHGQSIKSRRPRPQAEATWQTESRLVLIPVSVTDALNRPVVGLQKGDFEVLENDQEQPLKDLTFENTPLAIAIVFDSSGSMTPKMRQARIALSEFLHVASPEDELCLIEFDTTARLTQPLPSTPESIEGRLFSTTPKGRTALYDAVAMALQELKKSSKERKAVVIVSDGGDNSSRFTESEIRTRVSESDAWIYALGVFESGAARLAIDQLEAPQVLESLADVSGGRMLSVPNVKDLPGAMKRVGVELHHRYVLSYEPLDMARDGKFHRVKVKLTATNTPRRLHVESRGGYYAPGQ
jgi:VWFA-related protein